MIMGVVVLMIDMLGKKIACRFKLEDPKFDDYCDSSVLVIG